MSQPLSVAMLARVVWPLHGYGGIERHVFHLTTHLARLGVDLTLYVQQAPAHADTARLSDQMRLVTLRYDYTSPWMRPNSIVGRQINYPWYTWQLGRQVIADMRQRRYDIVHSQGLCAFGYAWQRRTHAHTHGVPFFANPHGLEEYRTPDWRKWAAYAPFRWMYSAGHRLADYTIATDACTAPDVPHYLGVDPAKVVVLPSAIDVAENLAPLDDTIRTSMRHRFGGDADLLILSVSRLERNKGYHLLAEALARAAAHQKLPARWRWVLVGDGKERAALQAQVTRLGIAQQVVFAGKLSDAELQNLYAAADFFAHPTLYEGSSLVTLEAMIHQRPVLATVAGGIPDKVFPRVNGILVPPGDGEALYHGLLEMLAARPQWQTWGHAGAMLVRQHFDWPVVAQRTLHAYHQALAHRGR
jgi:glycogen(starch) synthase